MRYGLAAPAGLGLFAALAAGLYVGPRLWPAARQDPAAAPAASAPVAGPRGGTLFPAGRFQVELVVRGHTLLLYVHDRQMGLVESAAMGGTMRLSRGSHGYDLALFRVGDHLQATSFRPETGTFDFALDARVGGESARGGGRRAAGEPVPRHAGVPVIDQHGDHTPRHGGVVLMRGDFHFEVVLGRDGRHRVYLSDEFRGWLPPGDFAGSLAVLRPGAPPEVLALAPEERCLAAAGRSVAGPAVAHLTLDLGEDEPYAIELDFPPDPRGGIVPAALPLPPPLSGGPLTAGRRRPLRDGQQTPRTRRKSLKRRPARATARIPGAPLA